jgi:hypothetical protein
MMNQSSVFGGNSLATGMTGRQALTGTGGGMGNKIPKGFGVARLQQYTPEQMQLFQQLFSNLGPDSYLHKLIGGDESYFDQLEAPALRQFGQLQGNIASRFSGMGDVGGRRSSGFGHALNSASSNFLQDLQSNRQALQRQALMDLFGLSEGLLSQRPYDKFLVDQSGNPSFSQRLGATGAGAVSGGATGFGLGGPKGAILGALLGAGKGYLSSGG